MAGPARGRLMRNPQMRALMTACAAFYTGSFAHAVLLIVYAFSVGGISAAGAATVLRVLPGGLLAPLAATLASGRRPQLHLALGIGARAVATAATAAVVLTGAPVAAVLTLVAADSLLSAAVRPLHGALVIRVANTAGEAAAANAVTSSLMNASALLGPALAGLALGFAGMGWAFALPATAFAAGAGSALWIRLPRDDVQPPPRRTRPDAGLVRSQFTAIAAGFRAIADSPSATAAAAMFVVNVLLVGIWHVASAAVAIDRLDLGDGGITTMMALYGGGGIVGALTSLSIVGRRGLSVVLAAAMLGWAFALAAIGIVTLPRPALALAAGVGAAAAVAYAIAPTLVQRGVARTAMVPATASMQSLDLVMNAAGASIAALLIQWVGVTVTLAAVGGAVLFTLLALPALRRADELSPDDAAKLAVILATPMLAPLPPLALEQLARSAARLAVPAGAEVVHQGDRGDRFYMIAAGVADVTVDGRRMATLGPGGSFGEIALLEDVPRSATVTAREDLDLVTVDRNEFLGALTRDTGTVVRLGGLAHTRLGTAPVAERLIELDRDSALRGRSLPQLLALAPPLAAIDRGALAQLASAAKILGAPDGAVIIREGDYGDTCYVIVDGRAEVIEHDSVVRTLTAGDCFGELAILRDIPRTATVRAVGETTLVAVDRAAFHQARQAG